MRRWMQSSSKIPPAPGGLEVGSNPSEARNLIDGDLDTSWGPDPDSPLENWRFTLHLGRIVVASKIVLRFAAEDVGDPFLQFKVLVWRQGPKGAWDRPYALVGTNIPNFWEIGRTDKSNKQQRVFEFVVEPTQSTDELFTGDPIEAVRVIVTDSDFSRAEEISKEAYEALLPEKRGGGGILQEGCLGTGNPGFGTGLPGDRRSEPGPDTLLPQGNPPLGRNRGLDPPAKISTWAPPSGGESSIW